MTLLRIVLILATLVGPLTAMEKRPSSFSESEFLPGAKKVKVEDHPDLAELLTPEELQAVLAAEAMINQRLADEAELANFEAFEKRQTVFQQSQEPATISPEELAELIRVEKIAQERHTIPDYFFGDEITPEQWEQLRQEELRLQKAIEVSIKAPLDSASPESGKKKRYSEAQHLSTAYLQIVIQASDVQGFINFCSNPDARQALRSMPEKMRHEFSLQAQNRLDLIRAKKPNSKREKDGSLLMGLIHSWEYLSDLVDFKKDHFTHPQNNMSLPKPIDILRALIMSEQESIEGACFEMNHTKIMHALLAKRVLGGLPIGLILDRRVVRTAGNKKPSQTQLMVEEMVKKGMAINIMPQSEQCPTAIMHHKFMIFNKTLTGEPLVAHGSMNWTFNSEKSWESLTLSTDPETIQSFKRRYQEMVPFTKSFKR